MVLDAVFVLVELLLDLSIIKQDHDRLAAEVTPTFVCSTSDVLILLHDDSLLQVFHYLSLGLVTFFVVELAGKLFAYRLEFFDHKFEVFDGLVVVVSFVLDVAFLFHEDAFDGVGLLILLRLWRVARIINGEQRPLAACYSL